MNNKIIVAIDVAGFNYREEILDEKLIEELNLNPIQVYQLKSFKEIQLSSLTTIMRIDNL